MSWPETRWDEPDGEVLDALTRQVMFAADLEWFKPGPASSIRNPDGSVQGETGAERMRRIVRAALRMALANGLVTAVPLDEWPEYTATEPPA